MQQITRITGFALSALLLSGCTSNTTPPVAGLAPPTSTGTITTAAGPGAGTPKVTRGTPVVPGRPGRVFIMAAFSPKDCRPMGDPQMTIDNPPKQGDVSFKPGQETTIQYSLTGKCTGQRVPGTGIYYTARAGATGTDSFSVSARMPDGTTATRAFNVRIAQ